MKMTITMETERTIILSRKTARYKCGRCGEETKMVTPEDASAVTGENPDTIFERIQNGELHAVEIENGRSLICVASLMEKRN